MSTPTAAVPRHEPDPTRRTRLRRLAIAASASMSLLYALIFAGVLSVGRASDGDLGILGVAGAVFAVLAVLLWRTASRLLWAGAAVLQVLMAWMYLSVAPERDPSFEVWGLSIRALSAALTVALLGLLVDAGRGNTAVR